MKIELNGIDSVYDATIRTDDIAVKKTTEDKSSLPRDKVEFSEQSKKYSQLNSIKEEITSDVDMGAGPEKLRALKAAVMNGSYHVSSEDIAGAMLRGIGLDE